MSSERTAVPTVSPRRDTKQWGPEESSGLRERIRAGRAAAAALGTWVLESPAGSDGSLRRPPIHPLPFRIGRANGLELVLSSNHVSKAHAEIYSDGLTLRVRDLGSRNGTFLNRENVSDGPLHDGDVRHVGEYEFRFARGMQEERLLPHRRLQRRMATAVLACRDHLAGRSPGGAPGGRRGRAQRQGR